MKKEETQKRIYRREGKEKNRREIKIKILKMRRGKTRKIEGGNKEKIVNKKELKEERRVRRLRREELSKKEGKRGGE